MKYPSNLKDEEWEIIKTIYRVLEEGQKSVHNAN